MKTEIQSDALNGGLTGRSTQLVKDKRIIGWERASLIPKYKEKLYVKEHQHGF